jgi:hypothetical protein
MEVVIKKGLMVLLLLIIGFVVYNLLTDINGYLYTKNINVMDTLLANKIVI